MSRLTDRVESRAELIFTFDHTRQITTIAEMKLIEGTIRGQRYWNPHLSGQITVAANKQYADHLTPAHWAARRFAADLDPRTQHPWTGGLAYLRLTVTRINGASDPLSVMSKSPGGKIAQWTASLKGGKLSVISARHGQITDPSRPAQETRIFDRLTIGNAKLSNQNQTCTITFASEDQRLAEDVIARRDEQQGTPGVTSPATIGYIAGTLLRNRGYLRPTAFPAALAARRPPTGDLVLRVQDKPWNALVQKCAEVGLQPYVTEGGQWSLREMESGVTPPDPSITHPGHIAIDVEASVSREGAWASHVLGVINRVGEDPLTSYLGPLDVWPGRKVHVASGQYEHGFDLPTVHAVYRDRIRAGYETTFVTAFDVGFVTGAWVGIPIDDDDEAHPGIYLDSEALASDLRIPWGVQALEKNSMGYTKPFVWGLITDFTLNLANGETQMRLEQ